MPITLPEQFKIVDASAGCVTTNGGVTCDFVSLKNVQRAFIVCSFTQAAGHATGVDPTQSTAVAGTGVKPFVNTLPWWLNEDTATTDTLVRQTDAITGDTDNTIDKKQIVFQIDPAAMDASNDFDVLGCTIDDSSQATNFVSVLYILEMRYQQAVPPTVITD